MVFAMLIASKLLIGVQLALKFLTMSHAYLDLFLPNRQQCFQQTCAIETGISDFHKMVVPVMKTHYKKQKPFNTEIINIFMNNLLILS